MATILVLNGIPDAGFDPLRREGHTVILPPTLDRFPREELMALLPGCDAIVATSGVDREMIAAAPRLRHIANYGAGYDSVDTRAAAEAGIPVTNIPETVTDPTAELAIALLLAVCRRVGEMDVRLRAEQPEGLFGLGRYMGLSLRGMTLGIIGAGRIGGRTAQLAQAFGMNVIGYSRHGADPSVMEPASFEEVITRSDAVSVHCPLTPETRGLISREVIGRMKKGAVLINTSRGGTVDHDALCDAIASGHLFGAGLDVYPDEPHVPERLLTFPQIVMTPHVGSNTEQTRRIMAEACSRQIL